MKVKVKSPYRDGFTGDIHRPGEILEVTKDRAKTLLKAAVVEVIEEEVTEEVIEEPKPEAPKPEKSKRKK